MLQESRNPAAESSTSAGVSILTADLSLPSLPQGRSVTIRHLLDSSNFFFGTYEGEVVRLAAKTGGPARPLYGQFSLLDTTTGDIRLIRDRLGLNKLFYVFDRTERVLTVGNSLFELARRTGAFNRIVSVPPGHVLTITERDLREQGAPYYDISRTEAHGEFRLENFHRLVDRRLTDFFIHLNAVFPETLFAVCLSGGLDSAIIASYAKRFLKRTLAVSFTYLTDGRESEDFRAARAVAEALDMDFFPVIPERRMDLDLLRTVLCHGQDWRDFNVHCAWLNDHLGGHLRGRFPGGNLVVLTGDLMNEYVADYAPVTYRETVYYPQPRLSRERLRRFLVYGLDTSDRELGIFRRHGLMAVQPYSILAEEYLSVPARLLDGPLGKERLNLPLLGNPQVARLVNRTKTRAQIGGKDGGVLGLFHESGLTQARLKDEWNRLFAPFCGERPPDEIILSGRYRT